jgi:hypothetical protein
MPKVADRRIGHKNIPASCSLAGVEIQGCALATMVDVKEKLHVATPVFLINVQLDKSLDAINSKENAMCLGYSLMTLTRIKRERMEYGWFDFEAPRKKQLRQVKLEEDELNNYCLIRSTRN